jgi:predicted ATPase
MIESIRFRNFKVLKDTTLPLGRFSLIVGPNGSGKSTVFQALRAAKDPDIVGFDQLLSAGAPRDRSVELVVEWGPPVNGAGSFVRWSSDRSGERTLRASSTSDEQGAVDREISRFRFYSLQPHAVRQPVRLVPAPEFDESGLGLAAILDHMHGRHPERFDALNEEWSRWLPEYDRILLETTDVGEKSVLLRTSEGRHAIPASALSDGTLLALAILTIAYVPEPPSLACFEEPDHGIHPRLLRHVQDALYRLSYPEGFGEEREPVQVIATTHSPYFLDLFKDHPEEVVIASKTGLEARFDRLSDLPNVGEILEGVSLGDVWYTGILGGVPVEA